jgi:xylulokinase
MAREADTSARAGSPLSLGLDLSTQSLTGVLIEPESGSVLDSRSLSYVDDPRLAGLGIDHRSFLVPPRREGEADQPPALFLAAMDALFSDMERDGVDMGRIGVVNISAQQHGHVYVDERFAENLARLGGDAENPHEPAGGRAGDLVDTLQESFSYGTAPIWMTSDTEEEAAHIRSRAGGKGRMIELSGSDSPLRFTGAVVRRVARRFPEEYAGTEKVLLLNTFAAAVLSGRSDAPTDFGNSCGTSLMNYRRKDWDPGLLEAAAGDLPGGPDGLADKLPALAEPYARVDRIAAYFCTRYGFSRDCLIAAGSGDNPQTKVLVPGDLLSLGTSFVHMVSTNGEFVDENGYANAMYDGLGRPFVFGCRTNGALVWDRVRSLYGLSREEYGPADEALATAAPGTALVLWQPLRESFPDSPAFNLQRPEGGEAGLAHDYAGIVDSSLGLLYHYSLGFSGGWAGTEADEGGGSGKGAEERAAAEPAKSQEPLYVTGGPTESDEILKRIAGIWNREVVTIGKVGAALGAAAAGAETLRAAGVDLDTERVIRRLLPIEKRVSPDPAYVEAYHGRNGFLRRLAEAFTQQIRTHEEGRTRE